jgi:hypothetical protein
MYAVIWDNAQDPPKPIGRVLLVDGVAVPVGDVAEMLDDMNVGVPGKTLTYEDGPDYIRALPKVLRGYPVGAEVVDE